MRFEARTITCTHCNYEWIPRSADVKSCPNCRTTRFYIEETEEQRQQRIEKNRKRKETLNRNLENDPEYQEKDEDPGTVEF